MDLFLPGPSSATQAVDVLFADVETSTFWRSPPTMSSASRDTLVEHWDSLGTDAFREFSSEGAQYVELEELFQDRGLDGRRIRLRAYVSQVFAIIPVEGDDHLVRAGFRLSVGDTDEVAWCAPGVRPRDLVPQEDQFIEIAAVVIGRGSANEAGGGFQNGTFLACAGVRPLVDAQTAQEVADLFRNEEGSRLWETPPSLSDRARRFLMVNWDTANPYVPHRFPREFVKWIGIDHVYEDTRLDGQLLNVGGYITQRYLEPAGDGLTTEYVRLEYAGQSNSIWCRTTVQTWRVFREGEYVEAVGVPIARGSAALASGGFDNSTAFVCPAMRR